MYNVIWRKIWKIWWSGIINKSTGQSQYGDYCRKGSSWNNINGTELHPNINRVGRVGIFIRSTGLTQYGDYCRKGSMWRDIGSLELHPQPINKIGEDRRMENIC